MFVIGRWGELGEYSTHVRGDSMTAHGEGCCALMGG